MAFVMGIKSASSSNAGSATTHVDWPSTSHVEPRALGQGFRHLSRGMDDIREVDRFQLRLSRAPPDAGELEEGVGEPVHPLGSGEYVFQEATARDRIIAFGHQELRREGDRGEWSAQLVGRAGQKLLLSLLESAPLREVLGHDQHSVLATVTQVRHVLKFDTQEGLSSPHAGFSALPLPCAARDRLAQVEVLPGAGELSVLLAHAEHGPPRRVGEDHRAPRVGRDHALGEVIQDGAERRVLLGQPSERFLQVGSHGVEGLGEGAKLVSETGLDAVRQMAALHQTGARTQALDPPREHHGQQEHQAAADEGGENRRL